MKRSHFARYTWFVVGYTVLVILWGAIVRATGSGAGCGNHWPTCQGAIIPPPHAIETLIEFGHRVSSGLSGILVLILLVWAFRLKPVTVFVRSMAVMSFIFILVEGFLGAMLVRLELVADNASTLRAIVIGFHLVNTLVLLAFLTLTAWGAMRRNSDPRIRFTASSGLTLALVIALLAFVVLSAAGAITALGDTLFPAETLAEGIQEDFSPTAHFLIRLRIWHPVLGGLTSAYLFALGYFLMRHTSSQHLEGHINGLFLLVSGQIGAGIINVVLLAPIWMQVVHLLLADALWILLVVITAEALTSSEMADEPRISATV